MNGIMDMIDTPDTHLRTELVLEQVSTTRRNPLIPDTPLLQDISCRFLSGELTVLFGPSGCGKSSLIRLLNRLDDPETGSIRLNGVALAELPPQTVRQRVGMMLQQAYMFEGTVLENLQRPFVYRGMTPPDGDSATVRNMFDLVRLPHAYAQREARGLSGGEQQRVSLARILISAPEVLLLDEPTSALDPPTAEGLGATLHDVCRALHLVVVMVSHDLRLASRIADQGLFLCQGRLAEQGALPELFSAPRTAALSQFLAESLR